MSKNLKEIDLYKIYTNWIEGCGPFKCFLRATNFVSLKHYPDFTLDKLETVDEYSFTIIESTIGEYNGEDTIFVIDLPASLGIKIGFYLQNFLNIKPVLVLNNPLHPYGIVGDRDYISRLIEYGELLKKNEFKSFAFILDKKRYKECTEDELKMYFNNQYELTEDDLPYHYMLEELGYKRVLYIYKDQVKEDISYYLDYLKTNNIEVVYRDINESV